MSELDNAIKRLKENADSRELPYIIADIIKKNCSQEVIDLILQNLKEYDNTKSSEALDCLKQIEDVIETKIGLGVVNTYLINIIKQALQKAQVQEAKIEILKEYRKDYLDRLKNLEKYSQQQEKENAEYKQLEEKLGCPLDVFFKAFDGMYIIDDWHDLYFAKPIFINGKFKIEQHYGVYDVATYYLELRDYKKTWWLKKDKSE